MKHLLHPRTGLATGDEILLDNWRQPIEAPPDTWLWHELTSMHGVHDPAFRVYLNLPDNVVRLSLKGTVEKRGRLIVLPCGS